ncbi:MAG TPA: hypothetical protein VF458_00115 [Ktedonobacteraceae bacterium]
MTATLRGMLTAERGSNYRQSFLPAVATATPTPTPITAVAPATTNSMLLLLMEGDFHWMSRLMTRGALSKSRWYKECNSHYQAN